MDSAADSTGFAVDLWQQDNAAGNDRLFAAGDAVDPPEWIRHASLCLNHQTQICSLSILSGFFDLKLFGSFHSLATFCRMGSHMLVLALTVDSYLAVPGKLCVSAGLPAASDILLVDTLVDYMCVHSGHEYGSSGLAKYELSLKHLFQYWNTGCVIGCCLS